MEIGFIVLLITLVFALIVLVPLLLRVRIYLNAVENIGTLSVRLFGFIKVQEFRFKITRAGIALLSSGEDDEEMDEENMMFLNKLAIEILKLVNIKELSVYGSLGLADDAFATALAGGSFLALVNAGLGYLITKKGRFSSSVSVASDFENSVVTFALEFVLTMNLISILACVVRAKEKIMEVRGRHERA